MDADLVELVRKAKAGDKEAFGKVYSLFLQRIYRFIYYLVSDEDSAYDLTQDTFVRAFRSLPRYEEKRGAFSTFLYAIARNLVIDKQRKRVNLSLDLNFVGEVKYEEDFEGSIDAAERSKRVHEVLDSLDTFDKELVVFRYFEEMSFKKIAKIVGKEEGAVRVRVFRILKNLKEKLEGER